MKRLLLPLVTLVLSGCAAVDAYFMAHYDPTEYKIITDIRAEAQIYKTQCENAEMSRANANKVLFDTQVFVLYSEHIPNNEILIKASKDLHSLSQGLTDQYVKSESVSPQFCKIKFETIEIAANRLQTVIAGRPR